MKIQFHTILLATLAFGLAPSIAVGAGEESAANPTEAAKKTASEDGLTPAHILDLLGAQGRDAGSAEEIAAYGQHFARIDLDRDGALSRVEFVDKGTYMTSRARAGIFAASDSDKDGSVSREEYVVNRRITDEAKAIMAKVDADGDGQVTLDEFLMHSKIDDRSQAEAVFEKLDTNQDGATVTPEYLRVWGAWARAVAASDTGRTTGKANVSTAGRSRKADGDSAGRPPRGDFRGGPPKGGVGGGPPEPALLFERFDRNEDGKLSESEAPEFLWKRISAADTNEDGMVGLKELEKFRAGARPGNSRPEEGRELTQ